MGAAKKIQKATSSPPAPKKLDKITKAQARAKWWSVGVVAPWYLRKSQLDIYELLLNEKFPFIEAGRRFGKTNSVLAFVIEKLIQNPGWICRWCFPEKNLAMEVLGKEIPKLQKGIPDHLKFKFQTKHSVWIHPNGSEIYCRGVNKDKGESARGPASNIIVCDEYGFWDHPRYVVRDALFPQLEKQAGQWLIRCSTPPPNMGHAYYEEWEEFSRKGRRLTKTILDNESLSEKELEEIADECGGRESTSWRRERMCEHVTDPKLLVVGEYDDVFNVVPNDYPRPEFYTPYVSGDSGADDNSAILFGYYDFLKNQVVIEYEIVKSSKTTRFLVRFAKRAERALWKNLPPHARSYDASKQLIFDIFKDLKWPVRMAQKEDKLAAIHKLRTEIGARRFLIKERCAHLRRQLKVGIWKDERHTDFERTEGLGHLDAVAAAIYFNRLIDRSLNPVPHNHGFDREKQMITPGSQSSSLGETERALQKAFGPRVRRIR